MADMEADRLGPRGAGSPGTAAGKPGPVSMTPDHTSLAVENAVVTRRFIEEVLAQGNLALLGKLVSEDVVLHHPQHAEPVRGVDGLKAMLNAWRTSFPDIHLTLDDLFAVEDRAAVRITYTATQTGEWLGHPATGKRATWSSTLVTHMRGGRITACFVEEATLSLIRQLGLPET